MFLQNKYLKYYNSIIKHRQSNPVESAGEIHHIIPKCLGGTNDSDNLVKLTYREHFVAHLLLTKMVSGRELINKMCWAVHRMSFSRPGVFTSVQYERARKIHVANMKRNNPSTRHPNWSQHISSLVKEQWKNDPLRRLKTSQRTKQNWEENYDKMREIAKTNLPNPRSGKDNSNAQAIEFRGAIYYGWRELAEQTGCTKHLYNKYYKNGLPFEHRIGANGPVSKIMKGGVRNESSSNF